MALRTRRRPQRPRKASTEYEATFTNAFGSTTDQSAKLTVNPMPQMTSCVVNGQVTIPNGYVVTRVMLQLASCGPPNTALGS